MRPDKKARHYAQVLFNVARQTDSILTVRDSLIRVAYLLKKDAVFKVFFQTTKITAIDKVSILCQVLQDNCHVIVAEFFALLAERKEWKLFNPTLRAYQTIQRSELDLATVTAYVASRLDAGVIGAIEQTLTDRLKKTVDFSVVVDQSLLGGLKLRIGNLLVDGSLQHRLERLRQNMLQS